MNAVFWAFWPQLSVAAWAALLYAGLLVGLVAFMRAARDE